MTKKELMEEIGKEENDLIDTSHGLVDVFSVDDEKVCYGFLIGGGVVAEEPVEEFLGRFK